MLGSETTLSLLMQSSEERIRRQPHQRQQKVATVNMLTVGSHKHILLPSRQ